MSLGLFRDVHSRRNRDLDVLFGLSGHWLLLAYGEDQYEEGFMAKVWDKGLRIGSPGIYIPLGIIIALMRESIENEYIMAAKCTQN